MQGLVIPKIKDEIIQRATDELRNSTQQNSKVLISDGVHLKDISINGQFDVNHKLGRIYNGYLVTHKSANVNVWDTDSGMKDKILRLNSSAAAIIDIWVF